MSDLGHPAYFAVESWRNSQIWISNHLSFFGPLILFFWAAVCGFGLP